MTTFLFESPESDDAFREASRQGPGKIRYEVIIFWSEEDRSFKAEVPELAGCASDGETCREAFSNAEQVIQERLETAEELGRSVAEPKGRLVFAQMRARTALVSSVSSRLPG